MSSSEQEEGMTWSTPWVRRPAVHRAKETAQLLGNEEVSALVGTFPGRHRNCQCEDISFEDIIFEQNMTQTGYGQEHGGEAALGLGRRASRVRAAGAVRGTQTLPS